MDAALAGGYGVGDPPGCIVHAAVDYAFLVLSRGRDLGLSTDGRPDASQSRVAMDFDLVLKDQRFGGVFFQGFFFSRRSCSLALV